MPEKSRPRPAVGGSAGRVIAGIARGRRLVAPGAGTRPLGDRVKQSLFAILEPDVRDAAFLDLFAGSGAAGIEALSRGARSAVLVEHSRNVARYIERNLRATNLLGERARIVVADAASWLAEASTDPNSPFDVVFADPPYDEAHLAERALDTIAGAGRGAVLAPDGVLVVKHSRLHTPPARIRLLRSSREERFGETMLTFYRWSAANEGEEDG